jgi:hypothetical protein
MNIASLCLAAALASGDVLIVQHTYDGVVERVGTWTRWNYDAGTLFVEFQDDGDGIFRNGFEAPPVAN